MKAKAQRKSEHYEKIINSVNMLTAKMENIATEYFEANVDFINQISDLEKTNQIQALSSYGTRFKALMQSLEDETRKLKREKVKY